MLVLGLGAFLWINRGDSDRTVEGPRGRPFYVGTVIGAERFVLRDVVVLNEVPDPLLAAACRNYRDWHNDVNVNPDIKILDDPGLLRSAELLSGDFEDTPVALEVERLMLDEDLDAEGVTQALEEGDWSDQELDVATRYMDARAEAPSPDADEKFVVFETAWKAGEALIARLEVNPDRELMDEPSVNKINEIGVLLPDGSQVGVRESLCWR